MYRIIKIRKGLLLAICCLQLALFTQAQSLITVKQDGTGNYTEIQTAIDAAWFGDTVLVWPGTYIENVRIDNKNIILASLLLSTGNPAYIRQTIIDANQNGSCLEIRNNEIGCEIHGFELINGSGTYYGFIDGGGIFIYESVAEIYSCLIHSNTVPGNGGGIQCAYADVFLSNTTIKNNQCYDYGGGIYVINSSFIFDTINKCNIYENYAACGMDICKVSSDDTIHVVVDTFTVQYPDYYYMYCTHEGTVGTGITHSVNTGKIEQVFEDLYVSPDGDNSNSGLSPDQPLKNISYALLKMASDTISPDTIHLANGIYSISNGEKFPLSLKAHGNIKGSQRDSCILDAEFKNFIMYGINQANHYEISNLSLRNADHDIHINSTDRVGAVTLVRNNHSCFKNVLVKHNKGSLCSGIKLGSSNNFHLDGVEFRNNIGGHALRSGSNETDTIRCINTIFHQNIPDTTNPISAFGGACLLIGSFDFPDLTSYFYNCLFTQNTRQGGCGATIAQLNSTQAYIINCTFTNNYPDIPNGASIELVQGNNYLHIYNSILFNQNSAEITMGYIEDINHVSIYHSLIEEGEEGIIQFTPGNIIHYDPSNIDADPMFDTASMFPYSLSSGSPCINAGTLDLPPGIELPETDLAGNPRVYDGYVDMGAYEYGPWVGIDKYNSKLKTQNSKLLEVFPNPFRFETNISYIKPESGQCIIRVYDLNGRSVKTLMDGQGQAGEGVIKWRGIDDAGGSLNAGTYIIAIRINGKERDAVKVVKR